MLSTKYVRVILLFFLGGVVWFSTTESSGDVVKDWGDDLMSLSDLRNFAAVSY